MLPWVCATGREPRIMLALRIMPSLTGMERDMRPLAKSCEETLLRALRTCVSVPMVSRFEPKRGPPGRMKPAPWMSLKPIAPKPRPAPNQGWKMSRGPNANQPIEPKPNPKPIQPLPPKPKNET